MDEQLTESTGWADFRGTPAQDEVDPWAWIEEQTLEDAEVDVSQCRVTAVLVTLDADDWLPDTLAGLARLEPSPTRLIAIDNASTDSSRALLQRAHDHGIIDAVYDGERGLRLRRRGRGRSRRRPDGDARDQQAQPDQRVAVAPARRRGAGAGCAAAAAEPRGHRRRHRHHRSQAAAAASPPGGAPAERDRVQHLRDRSAGAHVRTGRDRPGSARPTTGAAGGLDLRHAAQGRGVRGAERIRPGGADLPRRRRVRLAGAPARLPGGHDPERPDEPPPGRPCRPATDRASPDPGRERSIGSSAWSSWPGTRPRRGCRSCGCGWSGVACSAPSATCSARLRVAPGRDGRPGLLPGPSRTDSCVPSPTPRARGGARHRRGRARAAAAVVVQSAGGGGGLLRSPVGSVPLRRRRGRGGLAGRAHRRRIRQRRRGAAEESLAEPQS